MLSFDRRVAFWILFLPPLVWLALFFIAPLVLMAIFSFSPGTGTSANLFQGWMPTLKQYSQARKMMKSFSGGMLGKKLGKLKLPFMGPQ